MLYVENLPMLGNPQKGVELAERAIRLNPNYPAWYLYGLHRVYYFAGEFEKALAAARQAPGLSGPLLAAIYGHLGRNAEAAEGAANVLSLTLIGLPSGTSATPARSHARPNSTFTSTAFARPACRSAHQRQRYSNGRS